MASRISTQISTWAHSHGLKNYLLFCTLWLSACSGIDNNHVPLGTWQQTENPQHYMTVEPDGAQYKAVLFSVFDNSSNKTIMREKTLSAKMQQGVLMLKADHETDIPVLYHPDGHVVLVNGVTEFRRVPDEFAQLTLRQDE